MVNDSKVTPEITDPCADTTQSVASALDPLDVRITRWNQEMKYVNDGQWQIDENIYKTRLEECLDGFVHLDVDERPNAAEEKTTYPCLFDTIDDADMLKWGYSSDLIAAMRVAFGGTGFVVQLSRSAQG